MNLNERYSNKTSSKVNGKNILKWDLLETQIEDSILSTEMLKLQKYAYTNFRKIIVGLFDADTLAAVIDQKLKKYVGFLLVKKRSY